MISANINLQIKYQYIIKAILYILTEKYNILICNQNIGIISLIEYTHDNLIFVTLKAIILSAAGNKYRTKGYKSPNPKLDKESFINAG